MKKIIILLGIAVAVIALQSCTHRTCPTYSHYNRVEPGNPKCPSEITKL